MKQWEFLLQKDGDRSWLPLESPDVEILEGRYRIVARSAQPHTDVELRICHLSTDEELPKRRIQKRTRRTNDKGLMVVIPFTHLEAGVWEFHCSSADLMSDLLGDTWHCAVRLDVLSYVDEDHWDEAHPDDGFHLPDSESLVAPDLPGLAVVLGSAANDLNQPSEQPQPAPDYMPVMAELPPLDIQEGLPCLEAQPETDDGDMDGTVIEMGAPSTQELAALNLEMAKALNLSIDELMHLTEQLSHQLIDDILQEMDLNDVADLSSRRRSAERGAAIAPAHASVKAVSGEVDHAMSDPTPATSDADMSRLRLTLNQATFTARGGEVLTLCGRVEPVADLDAPEAEPLHIFSSWIDRNAELRTPAAWETQLDLTDGVVTTPQEIQMCLRDPQTSRLLVSDRQPLTLGPLPHSFRFTFTLPKDLTTHLLLGEVLLCGTPAMEDADAAPAPITLRSQSFTITVNPDELMQEFTKLNQVLTDGGTPSAAGMDLQFMNLIRPQARPSLDLSFLNLTAEMPPQPSPLQMSTSSQQILPPQIYAPEPTAATQKRALVLPTFRDRSAVATLTETETDVATDAASPTIPAPESVVTDPDTAFPRDEPIQWVSLGESGMGGAPKVADDDALAVASVESSESLEADKVAVDPAPEGELNAETEDHLVEPEPAELPSPVQAAFQALKLHDRFLSRLNSLATDVDLSAALRAEIAPEPMAAMESIGEPEMAMPEPELQSTEVVVDDDSPGSVGLYSSSQSGFIETPIRSPYVLPDDQPVPMPTLEIMTGDLVAGQPIRIRVKLPDLLPRIFVKLWVNDRQSRSLLDGPRWIVDFLPNGLGELEGMTQLTVPFGSVEIQVEAIAVEMQTQRESRKVGVERAIIPPDLPEISLAEFEV